MYPSSLSLDAASSSENPGRAPAPVSFVIGIACQHVGVLVTEIKYVLQERLALSPFRSVMLIAIFLSVMAFLVISLTPMLFARVPFSRPFVKASLWRRSIAQSF